MFDKVDLTPATDAVAEVVAGLDAERLTDPVAGEGTSVGDVLDHLHGVSLAFAAAARKDLGDLTSAAPSPSAADLPADWRTRIPHQLLALAAAWTEPAAWEGMTQVGGVTLPGAVAGRIALNEVLLHGWELARAAGRPFEPAAAVVQACHDAVWQLYPADRPEARKGIFGPPVDVPADAPLLDRAVAASGRDPAWTPRSRSATA